MKNTIRFAKYDDIPFIMQFIDSFWKKGHILAANRKVFEWQYRNQDDVNFVIGLDQERKIQGILGFIPYDTTLKSDVALALWKANSNNGFLGIKLLVFLMENYPHRNIFCTGINVKTTAAIYQGLGMQVGVMRHWYRLRQKNSYVVAKIVSAVIPPILPEEKVMNIVWKKIINFEEISSQFDFSAVDFKKSVPYKSASYVKKRYFEHPSYNYLLYGVWEKEKLSSVFVIRVQDYNGVKVLRFIDCIGSVKNILKATSKLDELLSQYDAEYIDMYEIGLSEELLRASGWCLVRETENVIPNYFEPYEQRNIDIYYCSSNSDAILFKGDGDQDRPNS